MDADDREAEFVSLLTEPMLALKLVVNSLLLGRLMLRRKSVQQSGKKRADFVPGMNFRAWVFLIAHNQVAISAS